jgi:hypothetical protein
MDDDRKKKSAALRAVLNRYRGGRFSTDESGGAAGMVFFTDPHGRQFYIGGFDRDNARSIVNALNLTMELLVADRR